MGQGSVSGSGLRLVLSPAPTPAAALLVPRRLAGMDKETAEKTKAIEVRGKEVCGARGDAGTKRCSNLLSFLG